MNNSSDDLRYLSHQKPSIFSVIRMTGSEVVDMQEVLKA